MLKHFAQTSQSQYMNTFITTRFVHWFPMIVALWMWMIRYYLAKYYCWLVRGGATATSWPTVMWLLKYGTQTPLLIPRIPQSNSALTTQMLWLAWFSNIHLLLPQRLFKTMETFLQVLQIALQRFAESLTIFGESARRTQLLHLMFILTRLPLGPDSISPCRNSRKTIHIMCCMRSQSLYLILLLFHGCASLHDITQMDVATAIAFSNSANIQYYHCPSFSEQLL